MSMKFETLSIRFPPDTPSRWVKERHKIHCSLWGWSSCPVSQPNLISEEQFLNHKTFKTEDAKAVCVCVCVCVCVWWGVQIVSLQHNNYFGLKTFENKLPSTPPNPTIPYFPTGRASQKNSKEINCHKSCPSGQPGEIDSYQLRHPRRHCHERVTSLSPSLLLTARLSFLKVICFPISVLLPLHFFY